MTTNEIRVTGLTILKYWMENIFIEHENIMTKEQKDLDWINDSIRQKYETKIYENLIQL